MCVYLDGFIRSPLVDHLVTLQPISAPYEYVMGTYNDVEGTRNLLRQHGADVACVILEVMLGGGGCIPATKEFIEMLRKETEEQGVCLIFDEVMVGNLPNIFRRSVMLISNRCMRADKPPLSRRHRSTLRHQARHDYSRKVRRR